MGYSLPDSKRSASSLLDDYILQIDRISDHLLSAQEERDLAISVASGSRDARNQLVQSNAKLVIRIASQYRGRGLSLEDLVGEGNLGLIRAAEEFDPQFGVR
ncbi:MAG: polymerase sigma factor SigA, partial [Planctomycetota bacterium]